MTQTNNLQLTVPVNIYYSNRNLVSIKDVIKSLEGIDTITSQFYTVASKIIGGELISSSGNIENLEIGSLFEDIIITLNFKDEEEFKKALHKFGQDHPMLKQAINFAFIATVLYGLYSAATSVGGETTHIQANNNVILNINQPGMSSEDIAAILDKALVDKKAIAKAAIKLAAPAKSDNEAKISFKLNGQEDAIEYVISPQAIAETPDSFKELIEEKVLNIDNASVSIRATDLDKRNQGWGGVVAGIDKRLPITIAPNVDISKIRDTTIVDVSIVYKRNNNDTNLRPVRIFIENISTTHEHVNIAKKILTQEEADAIESVKTSQQLNLNM